MPWAIRSPPGPATTPYSDDACARSKSSAYAERLEQLRLVTLQAFPACSGATTAVEGACATRRRISADTDLVTVQAGGNDFGFGLLVYFCLDPDGADLPAIATRAARRPHRSGLAEHISLTAPSTFRKLNDAVQARIDTVHAKARVIVVDYGNPFPDPAGYVGPFCPYMDREELSVAADFANSVNAALKQTSRAAELPIRQRRAALPRAGCLRHLHGSVVWTFFRPVLPGSARLRRAVTRAAHSPSEQAGPGHLRRGAGRTSVLLSRHF
ncbi:hypothetical protein [Nakamurella sp.]|uniref:hypothetical protein n=1 Tax=Nakamurella sp. TaxID=1869182 RepID=UPI0037850D9F